MKVIECVEKQVSLTAGSSKIIYKILRKSDKLCNSSVLLCLTGEAFICYSIISEVWIRLTLVMEVFFHDVYKTRSSIHLICIWGDRFVRKHIVRIQLVTKPSHTGTKALFSHYFCNCRTSCLREILIKKWIIAADVIYFQTVNFLRIHKNILNDVCRNSFLQD